MLAVLVYCQVKPEHAEAFADACRTNHEGSIREPGVLRFDVLRQLDDPTRFTLYELYRDEADVDFHKATPHYAAWRETTADMFAEPRHGVRYACLAPDSLAE
jgi:autoinducer 2-degrading protein